MRDTPEKKKGFTLGELLIVVAIISVLVAVAVPTFSYQLEKAREAVDISNLRHAREAGVAYFMGETLKHEISRKYYDADTGELVEWVIEDDVKAIKPYGKGTAASGLGLWTEHGLKYNDKLDVRDCLIMVTADRDGNVFCGWGKPDYALKNNPFKFLATREVDGKTVLYPTRSQSSWTNQNDIGLFQMDQDVRTVALTGHSDEIDKIYYILQMYYDLEDANAQSQVSGLVNDVSNSEEMTLRQQLFFSTMQSIDPTAAAGKNFFLQTAFNRIMCDAEAVTLATQFWAEIAEINYSTTVDATTGATSSLGWR